MILLCSFLNENFLSSHNISNIMKQLAVATILAYGEMLLIVSGMLDLSSGAVLISIIITLVITVVIWYILRHTAFGRSLYAIGGNEEAAITSGISVNRNKYIVFMINGVLVGIAGVFFMLRVNAGLPKGAVGYEMEGLTVAIVGGTSFSGGVGTTMGTFVGALIIGCLNNIMNLTGINSYVQQIVKGIIIALAVIWDIYSKNKTTTKVVFVDNNKNEKEI